MPTQPGSRPVTPGAYLLCLFFFLTLKVAVAGEGSAIPTLLVATTSKLCEPFLTFALNGLEQGTGAAPSSAHVNVAPVAEENSNVAVAFFLGLAFSFFGAFVIVVSGDGARLLHRGDGRAAVLSLVAEAIAVRVRLELD